ncbi:hypothetical protein [Pseudaquabacterium pictum]|uniref:Uncharacterized protein n=1 Tax=Pseudaquabacterium pictum TaxID=2315236 RepID=A0A480ANE7_9BURK|nr:hypothetical protein [Rubrivivax pictus]GCL61185.1 hypothetical protein AQPW35_02660 [Rubrivivax pictus]
MPVLPTFRRLLAAWCLLALPALVAAQPSTAFVKRLSDVEALAANLATAVNDLRNQNAALVFQVNTLATDVKQLTARSQAMGTQLNTQSATIASLQAALDQKIAETRSHADNAANLARASANAYSDSRLAPVSDKLVHVSRSGNNLLINGANVFIRNGLGSTYSTGNGLGNLILGYNESRNQGAANPDVRTGSHNLIAGSGANFTRNGAYITGINNTSNGHHASVLGGTGNIATGTYSVVVGGFNNQTTGNWATILGGRDRTAAQQLDHLP